MNIRRNFILILLTASFTMFGQAFKIGEDLTQNPKHKEAVNNALKKMQDCMKIWYFKDKKIYENTLSPILADDGKMVFDFIQVKLAQNSILVVFVETLRTVENKEEYDTHLVCVTSYFVKYGEIDKASIKHRWLSKKRVYPENNVFTEELWLTNTLCFTIVDHRYFKTMLIKGVAEIELINMGANFCN